MNTWNEKLQVLYPLHTFWFRTSVLSRLHKLLCTSWLFIFSNLQKRLKENHIITSSTILTSDYNYQGLLGSVVVYTCLDNPTIRLRMHACMRVRTQTHAHVCTFIHATNPNTSMISQHLSRFNSWALRHLHNERWLQGYMKVRWQFESPFPPLLLEDYSTGTSLSFSSCLQTSAWTLLLTKWPRMVKPRLYFNWSRILDTSYGFRVNTGADQVNSSTKTDQPCTNSHLQGL